MPQCRGRTLDQRERVQSRRLRAAHQLLFQIRNTLDPNRFTRSEILQELYSGQQGEKQVKTLIPILFEENLIEHNDDRKSMNVTIIGRELDETPDDTPPEELEDES